MYIYIYVCIYIYICVYIYIYMYIYICVYIYIYVLCTYLLYIYICVAVYIFEKRGSIKPVIIHLQEIFCNQIAKGNRVAWRYKTVSAHGRTKNTIHPRVGQNQKSLRVSGKNCLQIKCFEIWADDALLIGWNCSWPHLSDHAIILEYVECACRWAYLTQQPLGRSAAY